MLGRGDAVKPLMTDPAPGAAVDDAAYVEAQRFLHHEAAMLDRRSYDDWLALLSKDIRYIVMARVARRAEAEPVDVAIVDETLPSLTMRVHQLADPRLSHAENPPSLARRFLSNFHVQAAAAPEAYVVWANLLVWRSRGTIPEGGFYVGERRDVLRRTDSGLALAHREVRLDHTVLPDGALCTIL